MTAVRVIVTVPPYASFLEEVAQHAIVGGLRLNTVMPLHTSPLQVLERLSRLGKPLWVDLKGRQLRVVGAAIPPFTEVHLSHPIRVRTPVDIFFSDGRERALLVGVDGNRLILQDGPRRLVGPGESVNIVDASLEVDGTLTATDRAYLAAMRQLGLKQVMLSYVESAADAEEVRQLLPQAQLLLKIESQRGLRFIHRPRAAGDHLMAARGDLYVEILRPHRIISALRDILRADPQAVAASRIFESLVDFPVPSSADIGDAAFMLELGYRTFMLGDGLCLQRDTIMEALNLFEAVADEFV
jgi:pyruvate kinase